MNVLLSGKESTQRLNLLLSLTNITSENVILALKIHLVNGSSDTTAVDIYGLSKSNFSRALKTLNQVASIVEKIKDIDFKHLKKQETAQ